MRDRTLLKLELVPLLLSIFDVPSILPETDSPQTISIARDIISRYDSRKNELHCYHLLLLGVAFHHPSCVDGNILKDMLLTWKARDWVARALMERGDIDALCVLGRFWFERTMDSLEDVLYCTCDHYVNGKGVPGGTAIWSLFNGY